MYRIGSLLLACVAAITQAHPLDLTARDAIAVSPNPNISPRSSSILKGCDAHQSEILTTVTTTALQITKAMTTKFTKDNPYVRAFWPADSLTDEYMAYGREFFSRMGSKLRIGSHNPNVLTLDCSPDAGLCPKGAVAFTVADTNTISFCPNFFTDFIDGNDLPCESGQTLGWYDARERALVHELTHTFIAPQSSDGKYHSFPLYEGPTQDVPIPPKGGGAYGTENASKLATGQFPGLKPDMARVNADNWALIAWGNYLHDSCVAKMKDENFKMPIL